MKRILITGSTGFIGSSLADYIEKNRSLYEVYGIDIRSIRAGKRYFKGDIRDRAFLMKVLKKVRPHYIFHLAGSTDKRDFHELVSANISVTKSLLDAVADTKSFKTRIVIPGSAAEYGHVSQRDMPVREDHPLDPINPYGTSKMYQILLALAYSDRGLDVVVGRVFNILGWATPRDFSIGRFAYEISLIRKGKKKDIIEARGLNSERDFLDIQDVCSALMAIAEKGKKGNIYNICSGKTYGIRKALNYLLDTAGLKKVRIKTLAPCAPEVKSIRGLNAKIKKDTKWRPEVDISKSLEKTLDYYNGRAI